MKVIRRNPFMLLKATVAAAAVLLGLPGAAAAQDAADAIPAGEGAVSLDEPLSRPILLERSYSDEKSVYEIELGIPGRKIPLSARLPLEAGQSSATLSLSIKERDGRRAASLSLPPREDGAPGEAPRLRLGLSRGTPTEVTLVRADASEAAEYIIGFPGAADGSGAVCDVSPATLAFAKGESAASFTVTALPSRLENIEFTIARAGDPGDRFRVMLPVVRTPLAAFENNFYVCFIKKIPFGTHEETRVRPDGTEETVTVQDYKGRWHYLTRGLRITITVALCAVMLGAVIGFLLAVVRTTHDRHGRLVLLNAFAKLYITVIRGTPMTVQLLIAYFIIFSNINNKILVAILAFGFNSGAYVAEIIRAGIESIDNGQMEAARSLGLSYTQGMCMIVLPQAIRNVLPALGNEFIVMLKDTSIASFIGLDDLARGGSIIRSQTYQAYIPFLAVAIIYLILVMIFSKLLTRLEKHLRNTGAEEA